MPSIQKVVNVYKASNRFAKDESRHLLDKYDNRNLGRNTNKNEGKKSFEEILKEKIAKTASVRQ